MEQNVNYFLSFYQIDNFDKEKNIFFIFIY